jgi:hypothetical protein
METDLEFIPNMKKNKTVIMDLSKLFGFSLYKVSHVEYV